MSRLDDAITALESALSALHEAIEDKAMRTAQAEASAGPSDSVAEGQIAIGDDELQAMKAELNDAMAALQDLQATPSSE